jgi:hypothetical protein
MTRFQKSIAALTLASAAVSPAFGQIVATRIDTTGLTLPANTLIHVSLNADLTTKRTPQGSTFDVTVTRPVIAGDYVVIPQGTLGHGRIVWRTGKGVYGKSAKMTFQLTDVQIGNTTVPLNGKYTVDGKGNTGWTVGVALGIAPWWALLVTGHSATVPQGTEFNAYTAMPIPFSLSNSPAQLAAGGFIPYSVSGYGSAAAPYAAGRRAASITMAAAGTGPGFDLKNPYN